MIDLDLNMFGDMLIPVPPLEIQNRIVEVLDKMTTNLNEKKYDPNGMYTGVPTDPNEVPVQDVDDL